MGHDVLTSHDAGQSKRKIPDEDVLRYSHSERRALLTLNRKHFVRLHETSPAHSGIVVCTVDPDYRVQATRIHAAIQGLESLEGILIRVSAVKFHSVAENPSPQLEAAAKAAVFVARISIRRRPAPSA